jgi:hypothetical protein
MTALRYRLRTLLIVLAIGPPLLAWAYWKTIERLERHRHEQIGADRVYTYFSRS